MSKKDFLLKKPPPTLTRSFIAVIEEGLKPNSKNIENCIKTKIIGGEWGLDRKTAYYEAEKAIVAQALKDKNSSKIENLIKIFTTPNNTEVNTKELTILKQVVEEDLTRKAPKMLENNEDLKAGILKIVEDHFKNFAENNKENDIWTNYQELRRLLASPTNSAAEMPEVESNIGSSSSTTFTAPTTAVVNAEEFIVKLVGVPSIIEANVNSSDT